MAPYTMAAAHNDGRHGKLPGRDPWFTEHCPDCASESAILRGEIISTAAWLDILSGVG